MQGVTAVEHFPGFDGIVAALQERGMWTDINTEPDRKQSNNRLQPTKARRATTTKSRKRARLRS